MKILKAGFVAGIAAGLALTGCASNENGNNTAESSSAEASLSGTLQGTGASSAKVAQEVWTAGFQSSHPDVTVNYSPEGSGAGRTAFTEGGADFAGSDRALKDDEMGNSFALCKEGTKPLNLPIYISPIAIVYNLDGVDELKLDAKTVAGIFAGKITTWDDEAIKSLNPDASLPSSPITAVHRIDESGTTENFTTTLAEVAPDVWTYKPAQEWPSEISGGEAASKTAGVIDTVKNGTGTIGYADASGVEEGMTVAEYSLDGSEWVGPTAEAAAKIVAASKVVDGREANDLALKLDRTASGYPFVLVSYAIACQTYEDSAKGELVSAYLSYIASAEAQEGSVEQAGNAPLSGDLATKVQEAAASIK